MGLINWLKGEWSKLFKKDIAQILGIKINTSDIMDAWILKFYKITSGSPYWIDKEDDIESINFAGFIDDVTSSLVTLDLGIEMPDTKRGRYLQKQADYVLQVIQDKVSEGLGNCGLMFKPNGTNVDYIEPGNFIPTQMDSNGNILGCVFRDVIEKEDYRYTRFEWQRFENGQYIITNVAFKSKGKDLGKQCQLTDVEEWAQLYPEVAIDYVDNTLFSYFKNPMPNRIDRSSALGVPIWHNALKELKDLDVAWSRKSGEVEDSKHMTMLDNSSYNISKTTKKVKMPRFIKNVDMGMTGGGIHEHVATLLTEQRIKDINSILAMISTKCGFSQGMFVLDEKTGVITATQVESDEQDTIRTIKNIRDALQKALENLFYALNVMADIYTDLPAEDWDGLREKITYRFGDPTFNADEDRNRAIVLADKGYYPKDYYLHKWEGYSEEEARELIQRAQEAQVQKEGLFSEE